MYKYRFIFCFFLVFHVDRLIHVANSIPTWCITKSKKVSVNYVQIWHTYTELCTHFQLQGYVLFVAWMRRLWIYKCTFPMTARTIYHRKRRHCSWSPFHPYNWPPSSYWTGSVIKYSSYVIVCCSRIHTSVTNRLPGNGSPTDWQVMAPVASSSAPQVTSMVHKHAPKVVANAYSVFQLCWLLSQTIRSPINIVNTWPDQPSP